MNWYYRKDDGSKAGPVSEATFRLLVAQGTIRPDTLVWHAGMADWQPLSLVDSNWASGGAGVPPPVPDDFAPAGASATFAELKARAKTGPKGNYWTYFGGWILWAVLLSGVVSFLPFLGVVVTIVFSCLQQYGFCNLSLRAADHRQLAVGDAFIGFNQFGRAFGCVFLMGLFSFLWSLLLIVPGIVKAFSYMLAPYVALENPQLSVLEAIGESRRLMDGNKWRALFLYLSFIGWGLLAILTAGILCCWLVPYQSITIGAFYRAVLREKGPRPAAA